MRDVPNEKSLTTSPLDVRLPFRININIDALRVNSSLDGSGLQFSTRLKATKLPLQATLGAVGTKVRCYVWRQNQYDGRDNCEMMQMLKNESVQ